MRYLSLGAIAPGRSSVYVEAWAMVGEESWQTLEPSELHFEFRGMEEAIANAIASEQGSYEITHMRFSSGDSVLGTWVRGVGYTDVQES